MPRPVLLALALAALLGAAAGCGSSGPSKRDLAVGECTTANPKEALTFEVTVVPCSDPKARSKIVHAVASSSSCEVSSVSDSKSKRTFCTVPWPPGSAGPTRPAVGVCTTADPSQLLSVDIQLLACSDPKAKSRIVKIGKSERDCKQGAIRGRAGQVYCIVEQ